VKVKTSYHQNLHYTRRG